MTKQVGAGALRSDAQRQIDAEFALVDFIKEQCEQRGFGVENVLVCQVSCSARPKQFYRATVNLNKFANDKQRGAMERLIIKTYKKGFGLKVDLLHPLYEARVFFSVDCCEKCGEEVSERLIGDETYRTCPNGCAIGN